MHEVVFDEDAAKRVARLSIAGQDEERQEIRTRLMAEVGATMPEGQVAVDGGVREGSPAGPAPFSKRRRSSAQQTSTQPLKRKFLVPGQIVVNDTDKKIKYSQLRELLLFLLTDTNAKPHPFVVKNRAAVNKVVFLFVPGLTAADFGHSTLENETRAVPIVAGPETASFAQIFRQVVPVSAPGSKESMYSPYLSLVNVPSSKKDKKKILDQDKQKRIYLPELLMTPQQLAAYEYPMHPLSVASAPATGPATGPEADGWVDTVVFEHAGSKTFALDCEMCLAASGPVLTRISLVDFNNEVVMDEYVRPAEEIVDYVTKYSGITAEHLEHVKTTLADVQRWFVATVSADDILIGHSLDNDLKVMRVRHPKIIDTSLVFHHPRGPPAKPSLKSLVKLHMDADIQGGAAGHDSVEDARACMDLVKLKLVNGALFGQTLPEETVFDRMAETGPQNRVRKRSAVVNSAPKTMQDTAEDQFFCADDEECVEQVIAAVQTHELVIGTLHELEGVRGFKMSQKAAAVVPDAAAVQQALCDVSRRIEHVHAALPENCALVVCSGIGDPRKMVELQRRKKQFHDEYTTRNWKDVEAEWNLTNQEQLRRATGVAKDAVCFVTVKHAPEAAQAAQAPAVADVLLPDESAVE